MRKYKMTGAFTAHGRVYPNSILQPMFDAIGFFLSGAGGNPPAAIAILNSSEEIIAFAPASLTSSKLLPGPGVKVKGTATFSATEVDEDIHFFALMNADQLIYAQAAVSPPIDAGQAIIVGREDTIEEAS